MNLMKNLMNFNKITELQTHEMRGRGVLKIERYDIPCLLILITYH